MELGRQVRFLRKLRKFSPPTQFLRFKKISREIGWEQKRYPEMYYMKMIPGVIRITRDETAQPGASHSALSLILPYPEGRLIPSSILCFSKIASAQKRKNRLRLGSSQSSSHTKTDLNLYKVSAISLLLFLSVLPAFS